MTAKRVIGIIMIIFGSLFVLMTLIFGLIFIGGGGVMGLAADKNEEQTETFIEEGAVSVTGEIISKDDSGTSIQYYVEEDGYYYEADLTVTNSSYNVGDTVMVYYKPDNPTECMVPDLLGATFGTLGGVFSAIGVVISIIFCIIGIPLLVVGIILVRKSKSQITG